MQTIINKLENILPTGCGIDCSWQFTERKNGDVLAYNSFHCKNVQNMACPITGRLIPVFVRGKNKL